MMTFRTLPSLAVGLIISSLVLRTFVLLGFVVPIEVAAGSMTPTLLGPHKVAVCNACGRRFHVSVDVGRASYSATCPGCGRPGIDISRLPVARGDAIWVDRTTFLLRPPRRWEICVFRCPTDATRLCVKRIVGLPGEVVELRDGEVYINGRKKVSGTFCAKHPSGCPGKRFLKPSSGSWRLGLDEFFVLGDNSAISDDSRTWASGPGLPRKLLLGKPLRMSR